MLMPETYDITLETFAYGGEVLGRLPDGRAVFVPFALPGEVVRVRLVEEKPRYARAELLEVLQTSPERITPRCAHFMTCGGCHYQHLAYEHQLAVKKEVLLDQLKRIGGLEEVPMMPAIASPQPFTYRKHIQFHLTPQGELGFVDARSERVIPINECHLPEESINAVWPLLDLESTPGIERVSLRQGADAEDVQVVLESSDPQPIDFSVEELPVSVVYLGPGGSMVLAGNEHVVMEVMGRPLLVSAGSFFQVNTPLAEAMVAHLLEELLLTPEICLVDAYCGVGLFSAFFAERVRQVIGIEASSQACEDFVDNLHEFENVLLYEAPVEGVLTSVSFQADVIVVDPPRSGLERKAMDGLLAQGAPQLAYVSCDPATLARDAKRLLSGGYRLRKITPVDLFPQTFHIESISIWDKR
jgi:23S rRNA (uracil1939-C5)-methyltransferase